MKYFFNKLGVLIAAIVIVFIGFVFIWFRYVNLSITPSTSEEKQTDILTTTPQEKMKASLYVDFGNGRNVSYDDVLLNRNESAYTLLINKMNETNTVVITRKYDFGMMVESIDNVKQSGTYFWSYSVNGQAGSIAADKYILKDGDIVEWKYAPIQQ